MVRGSGLQGDVADEAVWWYRDGAATLGPVSLVELQRLAEGPLGSATFVWRKTFGDTWKRLDDVFAASDAIDVPPSNDYGRWTESFAGFAADPKRSQWSWLGIFGPFTYLYLGMWRRALVILSVSMSFELLIAIADYGRESKDYILPDLLILSFCVRNLKRDYYNYRVLGEPMWPRLRVMRDGYACGIVAFALFVMLGVAQLGNPADTLIADVAGVWQSDGANVVIDVAGKTKTITYGGTSHAVRLRSVNGVNEVIVFEDIRHPTTLITLSKQWSEAHDKYSVDLMVDDQFMANLLYVRPV